VVLLNINGREFPSLKGISSNYLDVYQTVVHPICGNICANCGGLNLGVGRGVSGKQVFTSSASIRK
jgi:hypothetical protein